MLDGVTWGGVLGAMLGQLPGWIFVYGLFVWHIRKHHR